LRWKKVRSLDGLKTQKDVDAQNTQVLAKTYQVLYVIYFSK